MADHGLQRLTIENNWRSRTVNTTGTTESSPFNPDSAVET